MASSNVQGVNLAEDINTFVASKVHGKKKSSSIGDNDMIEGQAAISLGESLVDEDCRMLGAYERRDE